MTAVGAWGQKKRFGRNSCTFSASMGDEWAENRIFRGKVVLGTAKAAAQIGAIHRRLSRFGFSRAREQRKSQAGQQWCFVCREVVDEQIGVGRYYCGGTARGRLRKRPGSR